MKPMTDKDVLRVLAHHRAPLRGRLRRALDHAARAITDRAALEERLWSVPLSDGFAIFCDGVRRHMKGEE